MGKRSFKEELEVLRSIFLDNLRGHSNLSGQHVAQIMAAFDVANKKLNLVRDGWINAEDESTRVKNLYMAGMSENAISETLSIDRGRIQRILTRFGIWEKDRWGIQQKKKREAYVNEIKRMLELGMSKRKIAKELNISCSYVSELTNGGKKNASEHIT